MSTRKKKGFPHRSQSPWQRYWYEVPIWQFPRVIDHRSSHAAGLFRRVSSRCSPDPRDRRTDRTTIHAALNRHFQFARQARSGHVSLPTGPTPGLSSDEIAFCKTQRQICLDHLAPKKIEDRAQKTEAGTPTKPTIANSTCGPECLVIACDILGLKASLPELSKAAGISARGVSFAGLQKAAAAVSLKATGLQASRETLPEIAVPAIAWVRSQEGHFIVIRSFQGRGESGTATIRDPNAAKDETISQEKLLQLCGGYVLTVAR